MGWRPMGAHGQRRRAVDLEWAPMGTETAQVLALGRWSVCSQATANRKIAESPDMAQVELCGVAAFARHVDSKRHDCGQPSRFPGSRSDRRCIPWGDLPFWRLSDSPDRSDTAAPGATLPGRCLWASASSACSYSLHLRGPSRPTLPMIRDWDWVQCS